jgi:hypothetical protein
MVSNMAKLAQMTMVEVLETVRLAIVNILIKYN